MAAEGQKQNEEYSGQVKRTVRLVQDGSETGKRAAVVESTRIRVAPFVAQPRKLRRFARFAVPRGSSRGHCAQPRIAVRMILRHPADARTHICMTARCHQRSNDTAHVAASSQQRKQSEIERAGAMCILQCINRSKRKAARGVPLLRTAQCADDVSSVCHFVLFLPFAAQSRIEISKGRVFFHSCKSAQFPRFEVHLMP